VVRTRSCSVVAGNRDMLPFGMYGRWTKMPRSTAALSSWRPPHLLSDRKSAAFLTKFNVPHEATGPTGPPVRSGCSHLPAIHEFQDMLKGSRQSSSHPMDLFWRRHLVTTPYVYGICMFASHCTGTLHLPCSVANVEPSLQP